jgi:hypothetical protein
MMHPGGWGGYRHHGIRLAFAGHFLEEAVAAVACIVAAMVAAMIAGDWVERRYRREDYTRAAQWATFLGVLCVVGLMARRFF